MRQPHFLVRLLFLCSITVTLFGCSDPYAGRHEIRGSVKQLGKAIDNGSIRFVPQENQGTESGGAITKGEFAIPRKDGLKTGKYAVVVTAGDGKTPSDAEAGGPGGSTNIVSYDPIPPDWNINSKQFVEVKSSGPNKFDFDIPTINPMPKAKKR